MKVVSNIYRNNMFTVNFRYCMSILMSVLKHIDEVIEAIFIFCVSESYWAGLVTV